MPDFEVMFRLDENALELIIRTSVIYLGLIAAMRTFGRRETGTLQLPELLMVILVADGVQNGMTGDYASVTGAAIVAATLVSWNYVLDSLAFRSNFVRRIMRPEPLPLVLEGSIVAETCARR
jgi:uncharacterized membrane protein YcaP (DUF421 family)